jgi:hypothetical protein
VDGAGALTNVPRELQFLRPGAVSRNGAEAADTIRANRTRSSDFSEVIDEQALTRSCRTGRSRPIRSG